MIYLVTTNRDIDKYTCEAYHRLPNYTDDKIYFDSLESLVAFARFLKKQRVSDDIISEIVTYRRDSTDCTISAEVSYYVHVFITTTIPSEFVLDEYDIQNSSVDEFKDKDPFFKYWITCLDYAIYRGSRFNPSTPYILQDLYNTKIKDYIYYIIQWKLFKSE